MPATLTVAENIAGLIAVIAAATDGDNIYQVTVRAESGLGGSATRVLRTGVVVEEGLTAAGTYTVLGAQAS